MDFQFAFIDCIKINRKRFIIQFVKTNREKARKSILFWDFTKLFAVSFRFNLNSKSNYKEKFKLFYLKAEMSVDMRKHFRLNISDRRFQQVARKVIKLASCLRLKSEIAGGLKLMEN